MLSRSFCRVVAKSCAVYPPRYLSHRCLLRWHQTLGVAHCLENLCCYFAAVWIMSVEQAVGSQMNFQASVGLSTSIPLSDLHSWQHCLSFREDFPVWARPLVGILQAYLSFLEVLTSYYQWQQARSGLGRTLLVQKSVSGIRDLRLYSRSLSQE